MGVRGCYVSARSDPFETPHVIADVGAMHEPGIREIHQVSINRRAIELELQTRCHVAVRLRRMGLSEMLEHREPWRRDAETSGSE